MITVQPLGECYVPVSVSRSPSQEKRFAGQPPHVDKDGYLRCWDPARRRQVLLHRRVYEWANGPLADGLELHHSCETRACCNPSHLRPMTHREHMSWHAQQRRAARAA